MALQPTLLRERPRLVLKLQRDPRRDSSERPARKCSSKVPIVNLAPAKTGVRSPVNTLRKLWQHVGGHVQPRWDDHTHSRIQ